MKLDKVLTYKKGKSPQKGLYPGDLILYLTPEYLRGNAIPNFIPNFPSKVEVIDGDLLLLWDFKGKKGILSSTMVKFDFNKEEYNPEFLYYQLKAFEGYLKSQTNGSGIPHVDKEILLGLNVENFKKPEQTRIAEILTTADEAIEHTEALTAKYQRIKTGLMQDLLTNGIDEKGNIRSKETHKFVVKNGIEVPEEWDVDNLDTLIKAIDAQPNHRTPPSVESGIPYIGISDIDENGNIDLKKCRKVASSVLEEHNRRYKLVDGDIIFGKIGTIGEPKRLKAWNNITISANVILIQPHETPDFIFWVLNSEYIHIQVKNSIHSTSQPAFGMGKIRNLTILIPPKKERELIQKLLNQNEANIFSTKIHLAKLKSLKTGLMQDLLSGKVRVS
jgi:type I restriction enzyme, S subunit